MRTRVHGETQGFLLLPIMSLPLAPQSYSTASGPTTRDHRLSRQAKSSLGQILGRILNMLAPWHARLADIDSAIADKRGNVKIVLSHGRNVVVPLEPKEAAKLVNKLNTLVPVEKQKVLERLMKRHRLQRIEKEELENKQEMENVGLAQMPVSEPPGIRESEEEAEKEIEEKEQ
jgi:hypothetical protein